MPFTDETIQQVWEKGKVVENHDPDVKRQDGAKAWIHREEYGNRDSRFGWEIDHIDPGGGDDLSNIRPLQWKNNLGLQEGHVGFKVTSVGDDNIEVD